MFTGTLELNVRVLCLQHVHWVKAQQCASESVTIATNAKYLYNAGYGLKQCTKYTEGGMHRCSAVHVFTQVRMHHNVVDHALQTVTRAMDANFCMHWTQGTFSLTSQASAVLMRAASVLGSLSLHEREQKQIQAHALTSKYLNFKICVLVQ